MKRNLKRPESAEGRTQNEKAGLFYGKVLLIVAAAAVVIVLCFGAFGFGKKGAGKSAFAVAEAQYPEMAPYPDESKYYGITGEFDDAGFSKVYDAWREDRMRQRQHEGYQVGLNEFCKKSSAQFLSGADGENRAYSPLNVYMALGMLAELTGQNSRQQILDVIGAADMETLRKQAAAVWNANYCDDGAVRSLLAASVWLADDVNYREKTMELLAKNYYASAFRGKMGSEAYQAALQKWLNEQTGGLLKEQSSRIKLPGDTLLALATTVLFQAKWQHEFVKSRTEQGVFYAPDGEESCDFMHQSDTQTFYWGEKFTALSKGLRESGGMWFILPDEGVFVDELLADQEALEFMFSEVRNDWEKSKSLIVNLSVPQFDVTSRTDLIPGLTALGITDVFDGLVSDFSPMLENGAGIYVSEAEHDVRVKIDEEGVAAAAYTVIAAAGAGAPPEEETDFVLNRPFLFMITGDDGLPLFVGVVNHPAS